MLCNNYLNGIEEQPGDQPIRVYYIRFRNAFGNIINEMGKYRVDLSKIEFSFLTENIASIGPKCTPKKIQIHDSFLSMLWGLCYGLIGQLPSRGREITKVHRNNTEQILDYSLGLLVEYSEWDKWSLPNPELHDSDEIVGKTNSIFWHSYNFILYHEFAHLVLGHFDIRKDVPKLQKEFEADSFAAKHIVEKIVGTPQEFSGKIGILSALFSILFCSYDVRGGNLHPDPHNRLTFILDKYLNDEKVWATAWWFFVVWGMKFNAPFTLWTGTYLGSFKNAYYQVINRLKILQEERNVYVPNIETNYEPGEKVIVLGTLAMVTIEKKFPSREGHFNTYLVKSSSGRMFFVSSDDISLEGSQMDLFARQWKNEMIKRGEKSLSIGINKNNEFQCFYHSSRHYKLREENPNIRFKWAWGQPS